MEHSSFANPNGLDDEQHYSTARDMAKLARAALENETLMRIASTRSVTIGGTDHDEPQQAAALCRWLSGPENGIYEGGGPDAGELCGEKMASGSLL